MKMKKSSTFAGKKLLLTSLLIALTLLPLRAQCQIKIAIINSQKAFDQSAEGQKAVALLEEREEQIKVELKKMDEKINNLKKRLAEQTITLSLDAQKQLQLEIDRKEAARQKYQLESSRDLEQFKERLIKRIREEMLAVIDQLIKERDYDLVFDLSSSGLIHYKPELDITEEVIRRYDASKAIKK
jgi:Skp family chaperone for outer membrane proteins